MDFQKIQLDISKAIDKNTQGIIEKIGEQKVYLDDIYHALVDIKKISGATQSKIPSFK